MPHFATYRAILVRYPGKQTQKYFAILSLKVSRDMKSIAIGPLSLQAAIVHVRSTLQAHQIIG